MVALTVPQDSAVSSWAAQDLGKVKLVDSNEINNVTTVCLHS